MDGPEQAPPVIMIEGDLVALGPLRRDLAPLYERWFNNLGTTRTLGQPHIPKTLEDEQQWLEQARSTEDHVYFSIYVRPDWRPVGNTDLRNINHRRGTAEFGIVIGEPDARGKGYGTEAARLVLDYAFTVLGLQNVMLRTAEFNLAGRRAYEKAGYREFGRRRQCLPMGGRLWDDIHMDCLASEFTSPVLARIFAPDEARH